MSEGEDSEVQCIMVNGHMGPLSHVDKQTCMKTLPSHNFVGGRYHHRRIRHDLTHEIVISVKRIKLTT